MPRVIKPGQRIVRRRRELGYTQAALADSVGLSRSGLCNYEKGRDIPWTQALRLGKALGLNPEDLCPAMRTIAEKTKPLQPVNANGPEVVR